MQVRLACVDFFSSQRDFVYSLLNSINQHKLYFTRPSVSRAASPAHLAGESLGGGELDRSVLAGSVLDQVIEGGSILNTGVERLKVPEISESAEQGRGRVRHSLALVVGTLLLNVALADPRRDQESGDTATQTVELESVLLTIGSLLGVGQVIGTSSQRRGNMVMEATALVKGQDEESLLPLGAGTERLIDLLDEGLAVGDQTAVVHGGGANAAAGGVQVGELGQRAAGSIGIELVHGDNLVLVAGGLGPGKPVGLGASTASGVPVVEPSVVGLAQLLEDGALGERIGTKGIIVATVATGGTSNDSKAVGVGRLEPKSVYGSRNISLIISLTPATSECQWLKVRKF